MSGTETHIIQLVGFDNTFEWNRNSLDTEGLRTIRGLQLVGNPGESIGGSIGFGDWHVLKGSDLQPLHSSSVFWATLSGWFKGKPKGTPPKSSPKKDNQMSPAGSKSAEGFRKAFVGYFSTDQIHPAGSYHGN